MAKNYITQEQLDERLKDIKPNGFSHYSGRALNTLVNLTEFVTAATVIVGGLAYGAMSFAYGPYDTGKVIYAELFGDTSLKHRHVEEAKGLFARELAALELDEKDTKRFWLRMGVVGSDGKKPTPKDVSWFSLLDYIEDHE
tara:strand:- start:8863 stop:9285 length:423 start_codon:yes stop_codon:yes gene_type:complete